MLANPSECPPAHSFITKEVIPTWPSPGKTSGPPESPKQIPVFGGSVNGFKVDVLKLLDQDTTYLLCKMYPDLSKFRFGTHFVDA